MLEAQSPVRLHPVERRRPSLASLTAALRKLLRSHPVATIALLLFSLDLAFIVIQIAVDATDYGFKGAYRLSLETEGGVAQSYGWVKAGAAAYLLFKAWRRFHSPSAGLWAAALTYLGIDDALRIHEKFGTALADGPGIGEIGPLRGQDVGELIAYALIMGTALTALILAERRDRGPFPTMLTSIMIPVVGVFLFFAVVVDTLGGALPHVLAIAIEDGGELIALTALLLISLIWSSQADDLAENCSP